MSHMLSALSAALTWSAIEALFAVAAWPACRAALPAGMAWGVARILAPQAVAFLAVVPALFLGSVPFTSGTVAVGALALAAGSWAGARGWRRLPTAAERREILRFEAFYLLVLALAALYVPFDASLVEIGERIRDSHVWGSLWTHPEYPLRDPAFGGLTLRHYVFGWYALAATARLTGLAPLGAYDIALTMTFVHYVGALYLALRSLLGRAKRLAAPAAIGIACSSNWLSAVQAWDRVAQGTAFNWWNPSRVIKNAIDEFPLWTYTLGDLHPHFMALPLLPTFLVLVFHYVDGGGLPLVGIGALLTALAWGSNTWELPVFLAVAVTTACLTWSRYGAKRTAAGLGAFTLVSYVLALPFLRFKTEMALSVGVVQTRSTSYELFAAMGTLVLPSLVLPLARFGRSERGQWLWGTLLFLGVGYATSAPLLLVTACLAIQGASLFLEERGTPAWNGQLLSFLGTGILLVCELVYLKDIYGDGLARMNTIFKLYMPAWTFLGIGAVLALRALWLELSPSPAKWAVPAWTLVYFGYLLVGLPARAGNFQSPGSLEGLAVIEARWPDDARLARWMLERSLSGKLQGKMLEAVGGAFTWHARLGAATAVETYVGWEGHGITTYGHNNNPEIGRRFALAKQIWKGELSEPCSRLKETLQKEGIRLVAIGQFEREKYPAADLAKIEGCLAPIHREGNAVLLGLEPAA